MVPVVQSSRRFKVPPFLLLYSTKFPNLENLERKYFGIICTLGIYDIYGTAKIVSAKFLTNPRTFFIQSGELVDSCLDFKQIENKSACMLM